MARLPVWMQLGNIPLELFTQTGISYIARALRNPLYMDRFTTSQQRLAFAKVCVEVEATSELPACIEVELRDGSIVPVKVEVPWMPLKCKQCGIFGHGAKTCPKQQNIAKVWVPKRKEGDIPQNVNVNLKGEEEKQEQGPVKEDFGSAKRAITLSTTTLNAVKENLWSEQKAI
ncbi:hypothetical protein DITRI_Ditri07aG0010400 [Diplodiscus trichospermus]